MRLNSTAVSIIFADDYRIKNAKKMLFLSGKFNFLYVDIWFNVTKCKFIF